MLNIWLKIWILKIKCRTKSIQCIPTPQTVPQVFHQKRVSFLVYVPDIPLYVRPEPLLTCCLVPLMSSHKRARLQYGLDVTAQVLFPCLICHSLSPKHLQIPHYRSPKNILSALGGRRNGASILVRPSWSVPELFLGRGLEGSMGTMKKEIFFQRFGKSRFGW